MVTPWPRTVLILVVIAMMFGGLLPPTTASAQQGATMTVLRGQVAVIRGDGTAVQPAPSGTIVNAGDEVRTISRAGALITFFSGTEIELGEDTILVVEQVNRQGDRVEVSLRQVLGATINRVQTVTGSGSSYRVEAGGAVALVRGTTFAVVGPVTTAAGNLVAIVCLEDCTPSSTFAGCPLGPFIGYGVAVDKGQVVSECVSFSVDRSAGLFNAGFEAITTVEQNLQGETRGVPAGQVAPGQRQETGSRIDRNRQDEDDDDDKPIIPVVAPSVVSTPDPAARPCNAATASGGAGVTTTVHELGRPSGTFPFSYDALILPDRFDIFYEGRLIYTTGTFVSGSATTNVSYSGSSTTVTVVVTGRDPNTLWRYTVGCPT